MLPDRVSNPGPLTYESGVLLTALRGPAHMSVIRLDLFSQDMIFTLSTFERGNLYAHLGLK